MVNSTAIRYQARLLKAIRNFFTSQNFDEILTPPMVENPGMETHIHPFGSFHSKSKTQGKKYLHTSPEFEMKATLARVEELQDIYTICYCFRDEPHSPQHREQFIMLEWYRRNNHYTQIMDDCENLVRFCAEALEQNTPAQFPRVTIQDLFLEYLHFDILDFLNPVDLKEKIQKDFKSVPLPEQDCDWDDYYFLLFLNEIEPELKKHPYILLKEFPAPLAALSTLKNEKVCERFEIYMNGIEIGNCFNELTDFQEQLKRFHQQALDKKRLYDYNLPKPLEFLSVLKEGYPESAGIAVGFERLLQGLTGIENPFYR